MHNVDKVIQSAFDYTFFFSFRSSYLNIDFNGYYIVKKINSNFLNDPNFCTDIYVVV